MIITPQETSFQFSAVIDNPVQAENGKL